MKIKVVFGEKSKHILTCFESLSGLHTAILIMAIVSLQCFIFSFALSQVFKIF